MFEQYYDLDMEPSAYGGKRLPVAHVLGQECSLAACRRSWRARDSQDNGQHFSTMQRWISVELTGAGEHIPPAVASGTDGAQQCAAQ